MEYPMHGWIYKGEVSFDGNADMEAIKAAVSKAGFQVLDAQ